MGCDTPIRTGSTLTDAQLKHELFNALSVVQAALFRLKASESIAVADTLIQTANREVRYSG